MRLNLPCLQGLRTCQLLEGTGAEQAFVSIRPFGHSVEVSKGFQAIAATVVDYSKKAFEDSTRTFEQLAGAKSFEQAWEIQSQYAKKAFDAYVAHASKVGEMYVDLARTAYRPVEQVVAKTARKVA